MAYSPITLEIAEKYHASPEHIAYIRTAQRLKLSRVQLMERQQEKAQQTIETLNKLPYSLKKQQHLLEKYPNSKIFREKKISGIQEQMTAMPEGILRRQKLYKFLESISDEDYKFIAKTKTTKKEN